MLAGERFFFLIENDELSKRCNFLFKTNPVEIKRMSNIFQTNL